MDTHPRGVAGTIHPSIFYAWWSVPKGLCWCSSFQRPAAFELQWKRERNARWMCWDSFTQPYTNAQSTRRCTGTDFLQASEGWVYPFLPHQTLLFHKCSQKQAKHPRSYALDDSICPFLPCDATGSCPFFSGTRFIFRKKWFFCFFFFWGGGAGK